MKTQSAKAKGRGLQQRVCKVILEKFSDLEKDDVVSTSMGAGGEDVKLSPAARRRFPFSVECKKNARFAVYSLYAQAVSNAREFTPLLVIEQNRSKPLVILSLEDFMRII